MPVSPQPLPPRGSGYQLIAFLTAIAGVVLIGLFLEMALPPGPEPTTNRPPGARTAYVFPQLVGITPPPPTPALGGTDGQAETIRTAHAAATGARTGIKDLARPGRPEVSSVSPPRPRQTRREPEPPARHGEDARASLPDERTRRTPGTPAEPSIRKPSGDDDRGPVGATARNPDQAGNAAGQEGPSGEAKAPTPRRMVVATPPPQATPRPVGETREPRVIRRVEPLYPPIARSQGISGRVTVRITVATDGSIENVKIEQSTSPLFNQAALKAAKQMRFAPGLVNGKPVRADYLQTFNFRTR